MRNTILKLISLIYLSLVIVYLVYGIYIYFVKLDYYSFLLFEFEVLFNIVLWPCPVILGPLTFLCLIASVRFTFCSNIKKAVISGALGSFLMGFFLVGYFLGYYALDLIEFHVPIPSPLSYDIDLLIVLYLHLAILTIICLINATLLLFRLFPLKKEIVKVKRLILEISIQFSHLLIKEISELTKIDEDTILKVGKNMIKTQGLFGKYISRRNENNPLKKAHFFFDYKANNSNIENLVSMLE